MEEKELNAVKDFLENHNKNEYKYRLGETVKDPNKEILTDGIIHIIVGDSHEEIYVDPEYDKPISLDDCLKRLKEVTKDNFKTDVAYVIFDSYLKGVIYNFGNYDREHWYIYGFTNGFC